MHCNPCVKEGTQHNKSALINECKNKFNLIQDGKVFYNNFFATRFSWSKNGNFSNTVLSLSKLQKYDHIPFFVVLSSKNKTNKIFLANSTFLNKISHSSQNLAIDNIRGSFNGSDIIKTYHEIGNKPENFEQLFPIHLSIDWQENLQRLCETSSKIQPRVEKYEPTIKEKENIFNSIDRAITFIKSPYFMELKKDLDARVKSCKNELLIVSKIENNNIKGRLAEILITADEKQRLKLLQNLAKIQQELPFYDTKNGLGDYEKSFNGNHTYVDIKVKVIYLNSNPKAFNIDKFLKTMAESNSVFLLYFVGFNINSVFNTILCSVFHKDLLNSLITQPHWAGRKSRGSSQYNGKIIKELLEQKEFKNTIDKQIAKNKLKKLLEI